MQHGSKEIQRVTEAYVRHDSATDAQSGAVIQAQSINHTTVNHWHISVAGGNTFLNTRIDRPGNSSINFGDLNSMCEFPALYHFRNRWRKSFLSMQIIPGNERDVLIMCCVASRYTRSKRTNERETPLSASPRTSNESEADTETDTGTVVPMAEGAGDDSDYEGYTEREEDFFKEGRLFQIAKRDDPLNRTRYVLLDKNLKEGLCLQVFAYSEGDRVLDEKNTSFWRNHIKIQRPRSPEEGSKQELDPGTKRAVFVDEYSSVEENTYVKLAYTVNIPFDQYIYKDCGELKRRYLQELRSSYVDWLRYYWDLMGDD